MPSQNLICRLIGSRTLHDEFGVRFGVSETRQRSRRRSRRELLPRTRQIWRLGRPVAGAHRPMPDARAIALLQWNVAVGLRALAHLSATFYCNSPMLWPPTHSGRSWVLRRPEQEAGGGQRRKLSCECSANTFPKMPAARTAPDWRPTPSLRSVVPQAASRSRFALKRSTRSVALGSAPSLVARWDSLLLLSRPFQSALGRFLHLSPPWGGSSLFSGPVGACANFAKPAKFLRHSLRFARALFTLRHGAGFERSPEFPPCVSTGAVYDELVCSSNSSQSARKFVQRSNPSSCQSLN